MNSNQTSKWMVDATLFTVFILAFLLDLTGVELHQWIGIAAGTLAVYHTLAHWIWINAVSRRFFANTSLRTRLYYLLDGAILAGFLAIIVTGLAISSWLDLALSNASAWLEVHILASISTLILTAIKIGLHWRWVAMTARKASLGPAAAQCKPALAVSTASVSPVSRREFLRVMGVVGLASVVALGQAVKGLQPDEGEQSEPGSQAGASIQPQTGSASTSSYSSGTSQSCSVQCGHRCTYPGQCRRYVDSDGNNRCDHGECA